MFQFQANLQSGGRASPKLLRRMFAHHLFLKTPARQLQDATGKAHTLDRVLVRITHNLAPWFLVASLILLVPTLHWLAVIFAPLFLIGYFVFAFQSVKEGGMVLPTVIAILAVAMFFIPGTDFYTSAELASLSLALWCNRFSWWYADVSLARNPALGQLFRQQQQGSPASNDGQIQEAEVVEITDGP